jgi:metal-responsive CopG/Arc/MetJ family transcriptional regulator
MAKSIAKKARTGGPAAERDSSVTARLPKHLIRSLDEWAEKERMTRGQAMRWILAEYFKKRARTGLI